MASFKEDHTGDYYCDICEEQRNPNHKVYCCKECTYVTHIECALGKAVDAKLYQRPTSSLEHEEMQLKEPGETQGEIEYWYHQHPLILKEVIGIDDKFLCKACNVEISDQAYVCGRETCRYYLHKRCAELPYEVLHSPDHPLILLNRSTEQNFVCDICRHVSQGYMYHCFLCNFNLDLNCFFGAASKRVNQGQGPREIDRPSSATITKLFHFIHNHELLLVNCSSTYQSSIRCEACYLNILGPAYCCHQCELYIHESCLGKIPREIQIPSHPLHSLLPFVLGPDKFFFFSLRENNPVCLACNVVIRRQFCYGCSQCKIYFHFSCAESLKRPLISKPHSHNIYLFHIDKLTFPESQKSKCEICNNKFFKRESIYRCIECHTNFHLQCVISYRVKSECHIHPLTLKDCLVEDDSGEYYCDVCEEERDSKDDVYYCQECDGFFVAHIQCAIAKVEEVLQQYAPTPNFAPESTGSMDMLFGDIRKWMR
ncbi:hypothetical protein PTKIN_Ptkin01aG0358500 [Pterospermum kingtungense]